MADPAASDSIADLEKLLKQSKAGRNQLLPIWLMNMAFFAGQQWMYYNQGRLMQVPLAAERVKITDNRIVGIVRGEIAKMTKQNPDWQITPTSADDADLHGAEMGEQVIDYLWRHLDLRNQLEEALRWSRIVGAGFWKVTWDNAIGDKVQALCDHEDNLVLHPPTHPLAGVPVKTHEAADEEGNLPEGTKSKTIAPGDVHVETVSPFEIFQDPIAKRIDTCEWIIQTSVKSAEWVKEHYGVDVTPDVDVSAGPIESRIFFAGQTEGSTGYKGVQVNEYWCKPNTKYPEGRRVVWVVKKKLHDGPNPYKKLPFVMFRGIPVPGRFWPTSITEQLRGPQTELNKIRSQIVENASKFGNPSLMVSRQAGVNFSGKPGERIDYNSTIQDPTPSYLEAPPLPAYVLEQQKQIELSMQEISGQHEVSHAQVPAGVKAASAINLLQEADDTKLGPSIFEMEESIGVAGEMLLELVAQFWSDERTIMIAGEDHAMDALVFRGAALKENTRVEVQTGSMIPRSKAAKQASIQDMMGLYMQYGQAGQPMDKRMLGKVLKDMEAGDLAKLFGDTSVDESQINRENQQMSQGNELPVNPFDSQSAHVAGHTEYQKGPTYLQLPEEAKTAMERHIALHRQQIQKEQELAAQSQQPPQEKHDPVETLAYKDAPPDIKRQIEKQAGLEPSKEEDLEPAEEKAPPEKEPPEPKSPKSPGKETKWPS